MSPSGDVSVDDGPARSRARRGDGERLREELLDAAEALLVEVGNVDALSIRQIAKRVGCTPPAVYLHFADKDALVFHVCCRRFEEFHSTMAAAIEGLTDPSEVLMAMGRAYVAFGLERPEAYRVLFGVMSDDILPDDVDPDELPGMQAFGLLVATIVQGVESGLFVAPDPAVAAIGIWATMHGLVLLLQGGHDHVLEMPDDVVDAVCNQALDGLRAR